MDTAIKRDGFADSLGKEREFRSNTSWIPISGKERHEKRNGKAKEVCSTTFG